MKKDCFNKFVPWLTAGMFFIVFILYQFNVIAMHYIFGIISYAILIIAFFICKLKCFRIQKKQIISLIISVITFISVFCVHVIVCENPFSYQTKKYDEGVEITGYKYKILNNYGDFHIEIPSEINGRMVKSIGQKAFYGSKHFEDLIIPEGVEVISAQAFTHANYKSVILPNSLEKIENLAFAHADYQVDCIIIPNAVKYIGYTAFMYTSKIFIVNSSTYNEWDKTWSHSRLGVYLNPVDVQVINNVMYIVNSNNTATVALIDKNIDNVEILEKIIINEKEYIVTTIGAKAGYGCTFNKINIPKTILTIEDNAFSYNKELFNIFIPNNVIVIYADVFYKCPNIVINTEHEIKPEGWYSNWNCGSVVNWNVKQ